MANFPTLRGRRNTSEAEICYLFGYNGEGSEILAGTPVCWSDSALDGRTFEKPVTANFNLVAGIAEVAVGTAGYTNRIVAYGPVTTRTYGVATTFVPGANLQLITAKDYVAYGSAMLVTSQPRVFAALDTHSTADTLSQSVFVRAL